MKASDYGRNDFVELLNDQFIITAPKNHYQRVLEKRKAFSFLQGSLYSFVEIGYMIRKVKKIPTFTSICC